MNAARQAPVTDDARLWCCLSSARTDGLEHSQACSDRAAQRAAASTHGAVPLGPFAEAPLELAQWVYESPAVDVALPAQLWLRGILRDAGVELAEHDRRVVAELVRLVDRPTLQVLGGFVARANRGVTMGGERS